MAASLLLRPRALDNGVLMGSVPQNMAPGALTGGHASPTLQAEDRKRRNSLIFSNTDGV
ncbi:hypothetical protein D4764_17G0001570 [Takifugu flavidus]|uniref:Uncharacterized protein n=1 Tax=Takifugu flavidus TaxID=433684 RepID=A0A5C6NT57_9TELE|nr:hypothetical protein D4764_17G0001570 [Takifugu flavidus]